MTRAEALAQYATAFAQNAAAWRLAHAADLSDIPLATRLHEASVAANAAYKVAYANRTKYAPAI